MPFNAKAIEVMIATPSDLATEREVVRDVINEWNYVHSRDKNLVLIPLGWETHVSPSMGDRPQAIINKQVLKNCDLLIAAFWTRLGTPTGKHVSGTVEEIEEHLAAGKPAMIYFCAKPVALDSVDEKQRKALAKFKEACRQRGFIGEFDTPVDFKEKLARQLAQTVLRHFAKKNGPPNEKDLAYLKPPPMPALSPFARTLLREAVLDEQGALACFQSERGLSIYTNGFDIAAANFPRRDAQWEAALRQLRKLDLIEDRGRKGEDLHVTSAGYDIAKLLRREPLNVVG